MYRQRNNQSEPEPTALFVSGEQAFGLEPVKIVEIGNSHFAQNISYLNASAIVGSAVTFGVLRSDANGQ